MAVKVLQRLLTRPWARALAIVGTYLLALQSANLPLLTAPAPAACCCAHKDAHCRCKVCTHAREVDSNRPTLQTCGASNAVAAIGAVDKAFPAQVAEPQPFVSDSLPVGSQPSFSPDPVREVPTPPPLART